MYLTNAENFLLEEIKKHGRLSIFDLDNSQIPVAKSLLSRNLISERCYGNDVYGKDHTLPVFYIEMPEKKEADNLH